MTKSSAELSQEFSAKARAFADLVRELDDEQWQAICEAEQWSVGTTAHHVGESFGATWGMTGAMLANSVPPVSWDDINAANAEHAASFPNPDKAETMALIEASSATVAEAMAGLDDESLDHTAVIPAFSPEPLAVRNWIEMVVIGHIGMHQPSIEAATGKN